MARIVMKFGGTSVADLERIRHVAGKVAAEVAAGHQVAVAVSAMAGVTNQLVGYAGAASRLYDLREYDAIVSSGENVTAGLLAIVLQDMGVQARSWQGWQIPIVTDNAHGSARIERIEVEDLLRRMAEGEVAVVAGFQGFEPVRRRITTLGRGGTDTSAVALAAALAAERCDIYTDVDGVYTCDPRIVQRARKIDRITYEEMLEMASQGAKVLQTRSVEMAMKHRVPVRVLSSFEEGTGTLVADEDESVEKAVVSGVTYSRDEAKITLRNVTDRPGVAAAIFGPLAEASVNVDMIVQNISADQQTTDMTFTVPRAELARATDVIEAHRERFGFTDISVDSNVVKVSVIGVGMRSHA
ncbi:MAG: aspartate kinase, partial [Tistlia sp.]|uniref:aspartate kinase n=1 Tax=Tistlia sp. TaxID=3057121 RepID=UPI0034A1CF76